MKIFTPAHFLRYISMPLLQEFMEAHRLGPRLRIDWESPADTLPVNIIEAIEALDASLPNADLQRNELAAIRNDLSLWHDDLRRVHLLSNDLAVNEFHLACSKDPKVLQAVVDLDVREQALWIFTFRIQVFRDVELHLAFQAKTNGKYWKKHRIQTGLTLTTEREKLEAFSHEVAKLYKNAGGGKSTHIEPSRPNSDGSIQLTIYVEGPLTALTHFSESKFNRVTTRIALETAVVYQPASGIIESVVLGGAKNHHAVLQLFGKYVAQQM